jgi:DNA-binding NarL/FixJ family response regulator
MLNIALAEDNDLVRKEIRNLLEADQGIRVVADAANGQELLSKISDDQHIDLLLTDLNMPEMGGLELIREMKIRNPGIKTLILTIYDHENYVVASFREGVSGYVLKDDHADELLFSIQHIRIGGRYLSSALAIRMLDQKCYEQIGFN